MRVSVDKYGHFSRDVDEAMEHMNECRNMADIGQELAGPDSAAGG